MDNFTVVCQDYARIHPAPMKVGVLGYLPEKYGFVDHAFDTFNFSFILEGEGIFGYAGQEPVAIKAPCVLTQWPGMPMHYGPQNGRYWKELFLIYNRSELPAISDAGYHNPRRRWWSVANHARFDSAIHNLLALASGQIDSGAADRIDRAAELAVLESLLPGPELICRNDRTVLRIRKQVESSLRADYDFDRLALENGMSPSVFRRHWKKLVGLPPHRFVIEQRMIHARRLLTESTLNIAEIARICGYDDPLYFSRLFQKTTGMNASAYRKYYSPDKT